MANNWWHWFLNHGTRWVTCSALIQETTPVLTSATWNKTGVFASRVRVLTSRTSAMCQAWSAGSDTITVIPALTCQHTGSCSASVMTLDWSTCIPSDCDQLHYCACRLILMCWSWNQTCTAPARISCLRVTDVTPHSSPPWVGYICVSLNCLLSGTINLFHQLSKWFRVSEAVHNCQNGLCRNNNRVVFVSITWSNLSLFVFHQNTWSLT